MFCFFYCYLFPVIFISLQCPHKHRYPFSHFSNMYIKSNLHIWKVTVLYIYTNVYIPIPYIRHNFKYHCFLIFSCNIFLVLHVVLHVNLVLIVEYCWYVVTCICHILTSSSQQWSTRLPSILLLQTMILEMSSYLFTSVKFNCGVYWVEYVGESWGICTPYFTGYFLIPL